MKTRQQTWAKNNRDRKNAQARAWRARNKDKCLEYSRRYMWRKRGAPEPARPCPEFCEVCGGKSAGKKRALCLDHDHKTGKFRGWLCDACNIVLGKVQDSPARLRALIKYLGET